MKRLLRNRIAFLIAFLLLSGTVYAQTGTITTAGATCASDRVNSTNCVVVGVGTNVATITFDISGTFTGTYQLEFLAVPSGSWKALSSVDLVALSNATSGTAAKTFATPNNNYSAVRVRASALASGSMSVVIGLTSRQSVVGVAFGGGGATIGTVNQGTATDASNNWTVNCVTGCSGGTTDTDDGSIAAAQSTGLSLGLTMVYDSTVWRRLTFGQAVMASSLPVTIASNQSSIPVAATLGAETTKVIGTVNLPSTQNTNLSNIDSATSRLTSSATNITAGGALATTSFMIGGRYKSTQDTFTNGQEGSLAISSRGALFIANGTEAFTSTVTQGTASNLKAQVQPTDSGGTDATNTTLHAVKMDVVGINGVAPTADVTTDCDTGAGTQNCIGYGILVPASGGAAFVPGDGTNGLKVQNTTATPAGTNLIGSVVNWPGTLKSGLTTAMTGTTSTAVVAAQASNYLYISSCSVNNTHASVDTLVNLQDGSGGTTLWTFTAPHGYGGESHTFQSPLKVPTLGNGLYAADVTTGASVIVSCQGFYSTVSY